ncbi:MAG: hypothetical protein JKY71_03860 [Alphaproteobacteria bacterium]|nr:hypothetical protein [Alphaproteobacteria bacterium]
MTQLSPAEAVRQFDVSKPTLYSDMNDGKLSYTLDDRKRRRLDVAELQRLYDLRKKEEEQDTQDNVQSGNTNMGSDVKQDDVRMQYLEREIEFMKKELENRREEVARWQEAFEKAQETAQKVTLLLEDKSGAGESSNQKWEEAFKGLETRIANKEEQSEKEMSLLKRKASERIARLNKELEAEKSKTFWQKLFG